MARNIWIGTSDNVITITPTNINDYFTVSGYGFNGRGTTFRSTIWGSNDGTATLTLIAKVDISSLSFAYSYSTESGCDKYTIVVGGTTILNNASGTGSSSYTGSLAAGKSIVFTYTKDGSVNDGDDECTFSNMKITISSTSLIPRVIKTIYIGVNGVARRVKKVYIGVGGKARQCYPDDSEPYVCYNCDTCQSCDSCDSCDTCESCDVSCDTQCESCESCDVSCEGCDSCDTCESCDTNCDNCDTYCDTCDACDSGCDCTSDGLCDNGCENCDHCDSSDSGN